MAGSRAPAGAAGIRLGSWPASGSQPPSCPGTGTCSSGAALRHHQPNPEPAGAQAPDMWAFCERMARSLLWVALTDQPLGVVADALRRVGGQNWADGFPDTQYPTIAHAWFNGALPQRNDWSASTGSVWIGYFMWIKPHLLAGRSRPPPVRRRAAGATEAAADRASPSGRPPGWRRCPGTRGAITRTWSATSTRTGGKPAGRVTTKTRATGHASWSDDQKPAPSPPPPHALIPPDPAPANRDWTITASRSCTLCARDDHFLGFSDRPQVVTPYEKCARVRGVAGPGHLVERTSHIMFGFVNATTIFWSLEKIKYRHGVCR